jgi:hypothetical protein
VLLESDQRLAEIDQRLAWLAGSTCIGDARYICTSRRNSPWRSLEATRSAARVGPSAFQTDKASMSYLLFDV